MCLYYSLTKRVTCLKMLLLFHSHLYKCFENVLKKGNIVPIDIRYKPEKGFLYITVKGRCTLEEYKMAMDEITQSKQYPANINALWDVSEQDFSDITSDTVKSLISINKQYPERETSRAAFVVNGNLAFGMLRMYEISSSLEKPDSSQNLRVFKSRSEGEKWLLDE